MDIADKIKQQDIEMMEKHGWYAHYVPSGDKTPTGANYHTHGLERSFGHRNIQIILPLEPKTAHDLTHAIIAKIKEGIRFEAGVDYTDIMQNDYKVRFIAARESGRDVLRLLIPDKEGEFKGKFAVQLEGLDNQVD
jgi:hypothetical protein